MRLDPLEVEFSSNMGLVGSNQFFVFCFFFFWSYAQCHYHAFKSCALPPSLLSPYSTNRIHRGCKVGNRNFNEKLEISFYSKTLNISH